MQTSEATIESLNCQLVELGSSDTLVRAREHHDSVVSGMRHKHAQELLVLNTQLDSLNALKEAQVGDGDPHIGNTSMHGQLFRNFTCLFSRVTFLLGTCH